LWLLYDHKTASVEVAGWPAVVAQLLAVGGRYGSTRKDTLLTSVPAGSTTRTWPLVAPAGTVEVISDLETTLKTAAVPSKLPLVAPVRSVPSIVTAVPAWPEVGRCFHKRAQAYRQAEDRAAADGKTVGTARACRAVKVATGVLDERSGFRVVNRDQRSLWGDFEDRPQPPRPALGRRAVEIAVGTYGQRRNRVCAVQTSTACLAEGIHGAEVAARSN
jgi:hypothetical protein